MDTRNAESHGLWHMVKDVMRTPPARIVLGVVAVLLMVALSFGAFFTVHQYEQAVVTTWGKYSYQAGPGLGFKVPFVQSAHKVRTDVLSMQPNQKVNTYTQDNQEIDILFTVQYRVPVDKVAYLYEHVQDYKARLYNVANDRVKAEMGKVKLEHFAEQRRDLRNSILSTIAMDAKRMFGIEVLDFQFTDVDYTKEFRGAVNQASVEKAKVEAEEWRRVQAEKIALRKKIDAEGQANAKREEAYGQRDSIDAVAEAEARAIKLKGEATAAAMRAQAQALAQNPHLVEMRKAEAWDGALPQQILSGIVPFMQYNAPPGKAPAAARE